MSTDRKLLVAVACAAILALGFAIFSLTEDDSSVLPSPSEIRATAGQSAVAATPATTSAALSDAASPADYLPLSDGYLLSYLVEVSSKGRESRFGIAKTSVEGRETIRGAEYYKVLLRVTGIPEMKEPVLRYCRKSGDAWHELDGVHKSDPEFEVVTLPLGPRAGVGWEKVTPEERSQWKVEGTETVSLLGKQYPNCLRIAYERRLKNERDHFETGHYFLAPKIGLIKQVASTEGTRISFTLDHRSPETLAFYTTWAGTYKRVSDLSESGASIQFSIDGRYAIKKSHTDRMADTGQYERHPMRQDTLVFRGDDGRSIEYGFRRAPEANFTSHYLKCLAPDAPADLEYVRIVENR